ncbi:hypothetical protein NIES4072_17620 [Nostoc commune NIES-4072]|uniref:Uncharacterized protein n=1 Tax=Nostoc commune NIES-4072 TaxID=2005467 RepID=A0A2R5FKY2_NOSCO|nr:hypothetical protein [Nostoc commune]BBD64576.1 hypothetical protein NIES4070_09190 [Nostoc commune HK-02]GBG18098.1 hypothetical protein NIES4072_17620 [Nostoc commune NIES-4072]
MINKINYFQKKPSSSVSAHFEQRGSQIVIAALKYSYPLLEKQSILNSLSILLNVYQEQVIKLYERLPLNRNMKTDLHWINILIELCNWRNYLKDKQNK